MRDSVYSVLHLNRVTIHLIMLYLFFIHYKILMVIYSSHLTTSLSVICGSGIRFSWNINELYNYVKARTKIAIVNSNWQNYWHLQNSLVGLVKWTQGWMNKTWHSMPLQQKVNCVFSWEHFRAPLHLVFSLLPTKRLTANKISPIRCVILSSHHLTRQIYNNTHNPDQYN